MGPFVGQISPPSVKKYFLGHKGPPSFKTRGPFVRHRTISCRSERALRRSKNIFLVRGALHRLTPEGPPSVIGPSVGQRRPSVYQRGLLSVKGGPTSIRGFICRSEALCRSEGALRRSNNIFLVRGALRRLTEVVRRSEGVLNRSVGSSIE